MSDDDKLFFEEMSDVSPLKRDVRVALSRQDLSAKDSSLDRRRAAAVTGPAIDRNILSEEGIEPLEPWFVLEFKRPGIQNGVYRKLRQGRYEAEAILDLHRMTVAIARAELFQFIDDAHQLGLRSVLLIHGKGETLSERGKCSILKGCTNHWLRELDIVQAFHSARPQHGGTGAAYVLLRKSAENKRENRERFNTLIE
jgi:DNA-nicking Smr family endonuclease